MVSVWWDDYMKILTSLPIFYWVHIKCFISECQLLIMTDKCYNLSNCVFQSTEPASATVDIHKGVSVYRFILPDNI